MRLSPPLLLLALSPPAAAQSTLYELHGRGDFHHLGRALARVDDRDGDGRRDLLVGEPGDGSNGAGAGSARLVSSADGTELLTLHGAVPLEAAGSAVAAAGDIDGDGVGDLLVAAPTAAPNGLVRVHSGATGATLRELGGGFYEHRFGWSVAGPGDLNQDGRDDVLVGDPTADLHGADTGSVRALSGKLGGLLHTLHGDSAGDGFGFAVATLGDVDGDGAPDYAVGAPGADAGGASSGRVLVASGAHGLPLYALDGQAAGEQLGRALARVGDLDGDDIDELLVGGYLVARVHSGASGAVLFALHGGPDALLYGEVVAGVGDLDGDGREDFAVADPLAGGAQPEAGRLYVYAGADAALLARLEGVAPYERLGSAFAAVDDVDGDGRADVAVASPDADAPAGQRAGVVRVTRLVRELGAFTCGPAVPNSSGSSAHLIAWGSDRVQDHDVQLFADRLPPHRFGYFLTSQTQGYVQGPGGSQGDLCLGGKIGRFVDHVLSSGPAGHFRLTIDLDHMPAPAQKVVLPGETWHFQAWFRDANPNQTSNFTDASAVTFW